MYYNDFMKKMHWQNFIKQGIKSDQFFVVQRAKFDPSKRKSKNQLCPMHTHDYAEIFWVQLGKCYHKINGKSRILEEGDLIIIRPTDVHNFKFYGDTEVSMTNVVIMPETLEFLQMRYLGPDERLSRASASEPTVYKLSKSQLKWIQTASRELVLECSPKTVPIIAI